MRCWISSVHKLFPSPSDDFAERFKYDVISSKLLASSVSPSPVTTHPSSSHLATDHRLPGELQLPQQDTGKIDKELKSVSGALAVFGAAALLKSHRTTAIIALLASYVFAKAPAVPQGKYSYIPLMFEGLERLKDASNEWDIAVNDAITTIEGEERR